MNCTVHKTEPWNDCAKCEYDFELDREESNYEESINEYN